MKKSKIVPALLTLLLCASLFGCGDHSVPSEADGAKVVENELKKLGPDSGVHIKHFTKLNGQKSESNGVEHYALEFEIEIECVRETCSTAPLSKQGDAAKHKDTMQFEKTDRGWKGPDGEIY